MRVVGEDVIRNYSTLLFNIVETITRRGAQAAELGRVNDALEKAHEALELRFRDIAGAMSDWVWEVDAGARYTYCSEKVKDVLGYSAEEMIGKTPFDFMLPDEAESVGAAFAELVRERRPFRNMESWLRTRDGRSVCMLISGVPILDDAGELLGYRGVDSDITERKNAEEALQKEKDRAQHYLDIAGVMFLVIGADRKVSLINRKGCEILGCEEEEEIAGKDWFDNFIPERLRDEVARVFNSLIAGEIEQVEYHENPVLTKHGEERIVAWHNTLLRDEQGRIYATMASGEDITERKKMEETLRIAHENTKTILEKASFGVVVIGRDRKIKWVNDTALKMAGVENTDILLGENCGKYLCPAQQKECPILDKGQQVDNSERIFRRKDGKEIPIIKTVIEINMDGEAVLLETFIDITERKAAEEELKKRAGELEKFNKLAVSRELKMIELKKEINALLGELGKEPGYKIVGES
jgi:PAS domain S-box-containing protein